MRFIGVLNRDGGTFRTTDMEVFAARAIETFAARGHVFEPRIVAGAALLDALRAAAGEADVLVAGGGDGTISAVAGIAYETGVPLAVLPAGTMNLFARTLQMPLALEAALAAIADGEVRAVDIATANGRPFVHQFSVGIHAKLVKLRDSLPYRSRLGKMAASVRAFWTAVVNAPSFHLDVVTPHGVERRKTAGISVSNNPLDGALLNAERLDAGVLGIYIIAPLTLPIVLKLGFAALRGRWKSLPEIIDREAREVTIRFPRRKRSSSAAIDGELIALERTVKLSIHPGALKVVLPKAVAPAGPDDATDALAPA